MQSKPTKLSVRRTVPLDMLISNSLPLWMIEILLISLFLRCSASRKCGGAAHAATPEIEIAAAAV